MFGGEKEIFEDHIENDMMHKKLREKWGDWIIESRGVRNVYSLEHRKFVMGLVLERFLGEDMERGFARIPSSVKKRAEEQFWKMQEHGFRTFYDEIPWHNIMYNSNTGRIAFTDFGNDWLVDENGEEIDLLVQMYKSKSI